MAASSTSHQNCVICGFAFLHVDTSPGSSSSLSPIAKAPIEVNAPTAPPYPRASSAIFPFCRSGDPFVISSIGTPNMADAEASYIFPCVANTSSLHCSPDNHASTLASIAEKSATINLHPSFGINAVRINSDSTFDVDS